VQKALNASDTNTQETSDHTTTLQDGNLKGLAKSAKRFHTAASTTASTRYGPEDRHSTWEGSEPGDLSADTREHIEQWNQFAILEEPQEEAAVERLPAGTSKDSTEFGALSSQMASTTPKEEITLERLSAETSKDSTGINALSLQLASTTLEVLKDNPRHIQTVCEHTDRVRSVVFSPSGRILASGSDDATIRTWEVVKGGNLQQLQKIDNLGGSVSQLVFSHSGESLAAIIGGSEFQVWTLDGKSQLQPKKKQTADSSQFLAIAFSGKLVYTGLRDGSILEWPVHGRDDTPTRSNFVGRCRGGVISISFYQQSYFDCLIAGSENGNFSIYGKSYRSNTWHYSFSEQPIKALTSIAMLPGKEELVIGSADRRVFRWNFRRPFPGRPLFSRKSLVTPPPGRFPFYSRQSITPVLPKEVCVHMDEICCIATAPHEMWLAFGSEDHTVQLCNIGWDRSSWRIETLKGHSNTVCSVTFSPNGQRVVSASADHTIRVWDIRR
jgi:WD40 repeat protein